MPHKLYEKLTAPADSYPLVSHFLEQGMLETTRLLAELEGSEWFKVAIAIEFADTPYPMYATTAEEAWHDIVSVSDFSVISSGAVDHDTGGVQDTHSGVEGSH